MSKKQKLVLIAVIILLIAYILIDKKSNIKQSNTATSTTEIFTDKDSSNEKVVGKTGVLDVSGTGNFKIEQVGATDGLPKPIPDLNRPITVSAGVKITEEAKNLATQKISELQSGLKQNPSNFASWINLGLYQKTAGDYEGTILSWQYAEKLAPTNFIPTANLADLYANFIKDYVKAESYYKTAISKGPKQLYLYMQFAEFYRDILNNRSKALSVVEDGLKNLPTNQTLLDMRTSLK